MDLGEYLPMFLAECREHLQELNLAIVSLEQSPDDRDTVDAVFRIAHSLKGMSATMGFSRIAALTHEMEDVLELLRQRSGGLERAAIDTLLECLDTLSGAVEAIDETGEEGIEPEALIGRLRSLAREGDEPSPLPAGTDVPAPTEAPAAGAPPNPAPAATQPAPATAAPEGGAPTAQPAASPAPAAADATATQPPAADAQAAPAEPRRAPEANASRPKRATSTVRVDADRLDQLMSSMGELVVHRTQLESLVLQSDVPGIQQAMQDLTRSSAALRAMVMQVRMIEVEAVFMRLPRLVRDLSTKLNKEVDLQLSGAETELDRSVVDALGDPLVHLVRNSLDHGLESPEQRAAAGKPPTGRLEISARHAGGSVIITVSDDGRGVDPAAVARKAAERGLLMPGEEVDLPRAIELLFSPGFSTAEQTSDISGRGVGMDAVRNAVRSLGGEVSLTSVFGEGTSAQIRLPLTLAIMPALLVEVNRQPFAVPLDRVERTLRLSDHVVRSAAGRRLLVVGEDVLPLCDGAEALGHGHAEREQSHAVVVRAGDQRLALAVEELVGQRELVTRSLPPGLEAHPSVSGGAVLSDGGIALIIDCDSLVGQVGKPAPAALAAA